MPDSQLLADLRALVEIATMRALKAALDPRGILNPGKVFDVQGA